MVHKSIETKHYEERASFFDGLTRMGQLSRRGFLHIAGVSAGIAAAKGLIVPQSFQLIEIAQAAETAAPPFTIAYVSDTHLYTRNVNDRFVRSAVKSGGRRQCARPAARLCALRRRSGSARPPGGTRSRRANLKDLKAPLKMMVGEHDWFLDMGEHWRSVFGPPQYSFDHKGVHFVTLMSVQEKDFWTARGMTPEERMHTVAGLDNGIQSRFEVGPDGRQWLQNDLAGVDKKTPIVIFSHSPLYKYYRNWNFWTDDADEVQAILAKFDTVSVIHGHTHQLLLNHIGNISFYGLLSTAWPWPYAPEGLPKLTVQMNRADPFNAFDGCGDGQLNVLASGMIDKVYNLWNRNPVTVRANYLSSSGAKDRPTATTLSSY